MIKSLLVSLLFFAQIPFPGPGRAQPPTGYSLISSTSAGLGATGGTSSAINTTGSNLIVIAVGWYDVMGTVGVSDSNGNTWTAVAAVDNGGNRVSTYYCYAPTVGSGHTFSTVNTYSSIAVVAYSGAGASPLDQQATSTASGVSSFQPGSITPTVNNSLVLASNGVNPTSTTPSINSGMSVIENIPGSSGNYIGVSIASVVQDTSAAINPTWTYSVSGAFAASIASFKP